MKYFNLLLLSAILFVSCSDDTPPTPIDPPNESLHLQARGTDIVNAQGNKVYLKGVAFGNNIWDNAATPSNTHHSEIDYQRVRDMGMNSVRFYLNYSFFEDDATPYSYKQSGWDWIDENIAWAKKHDIYLILNMHAPQGGYQSQGNGDELWLNQENQNRLLALWKAIAERYKDEAQIAGFGLVNEPVPTNNIAQWSSLAQTLVDGIREVNENHLIFVEKANYTKGESDFDNLYFPQVFGSNLVYEFHSYDPLSYTHQLFDWANQGEGGSYPDENRIEVADGNWHGATFGNEKIITGTSNWTYYEGKKYTINDPEISYAVPALIGQDVQGTVYYDNITIKEFDSSGNFIRDVFYFDFSDDRGWYYWSNNNSGQGGTSTSNGISDSKSMYISGATADCNLTGATYKFVPQQGYQYQISGWMKGENVATNANCNLRIDFYHTVDPVFKRNKEYLEWSVGRFVEWGKNNNVPIYLGEFGTGIHCFQNNKGGLEFVDDMLDIIAKNDIHFAYHAYHEDAFGIYFGYGSLPSPSNANTALINLLTDRLN